MQHALCQSGQPAQGTRLIEVAGQHRQPLRAQGIQPIWLAAQGQQLHATTRHALQHDTAADIATAHNQQTLPTETGWQRTRADK